MPRPPDQHVVRPFVKRQRGSLWQQPGSFWIGVGLAAEFPLWLITTFAPSGLCEATIGRIDACPPSLWLVVVAAIAAFFAVAVVAHRLGL